MTTRATWTADEDDRDDPGLPGPLAADDRLRNLAGPAEYETQLTHWLPEQPYNEGFRRAAEILADHIAKFPDDIHDLTMPVMYCYRHAVELRLKHLWTVASWRDESAAQPLKGHVLRELWRDVKPILSQEIPRNRRGLSELDTAEVVVHELADLDPRGVAFRYPEERGGGPSLQPDVSVNLHNIWTVMPKLLELLDDAAAGIVVELLQRPWPQRP